VYRGSEGWRGGIAASQERTVAVKGEASAAGEGCEEVAGEGGGGGEGRGVRSQGIVIWPVGNSIGRTDDVGLGRPARAEAVEPQSADPRCVAEGERAAGSPDYPDLLILGGTLSGGDRDFTRKSQPEKTDRRRRRERRWDERLRRHGERR
jgi:hypothetical protein